MITHHVPALVAFIGNLGMMEWAVILIVALLLFGRRLPEVGRSMGQGIREFKKGLKETEEEARRDTAPTSRTALPGDSASASHQETREHEHTR